MAFRWLFARTRSIFVPSRRHLISISHITLKWTGHLRSTETILLWRRAWGRQGPGASLQPGMQSHQLSPPALGYITLIHNWYCSWLNLEKQDVYTLYILNVYKWKYSNDCKKNTSMEKTKPAAIRAEGRRSLSTRGSYRQGYWAGSGATRGS